MAANAERTRAAQAAIRATAQKFTVEEALNGLAAVAAECIHSGAVSVEARGQLLVIYGKMVADSLAQAQGNDVSLPGLGRMQ